MANSNPGYEAGSDDSRHNAATKRNTAANATADNQQPDEGTYIVGHQTYFADEKVIIPDIDKVQRTCAYVCCFRCRLSIVMLVNTHMCGFASVG